MPPPQRRARPEAGNTLTRPPLFYNDEDPRVGGFRVIAIARDLWLAYRWRAGAAYPASVEIHNGMGESLFRWYSDGGALSLRGNDGLVRIRAEADLRGGGQLFTEHVAHIDAEIDAQYGNAASYRRCPTGFVRTEEVSADESTSWCWRADDRGKVTLIDVAVYDKQHRLRSYGRNLPLPVPVGSSATGDPLIVMPYYGAENVRMPASQLEYSGWWTVEVTHEPDGIVRIETTSNGQLQGFAIELDREYRVNLFEEWFDGWPLGAWMAFDWEGETAWWSRVVLGVMTYEFTSSLKRENF